MKKIISMCLFIMALMSVNANVAFATSITCIVEAGSGYTEADFKRVKATFLRLKGQEMNQIILNERDRAKERETIKKIESAIKYLKEGPRRNGMEIQVTPTYIIEHPGITLEGLQRDYKLHQQEYKKLDDLHQTLMKKKADTQALEVQLDKIEKSHRWDLLSQIQDSFNRWGEQMRLQK